MDNFGVVFTGHFNDQFSTLVDHFKRANSISIIIRGDPGYGKKTLVTAAAREHGTCKYIRLDPIRFPTDSSILKEIANNLGISVGKSSESLIIRSISDKIKKSKKLIVVELSCLEKYTIGKQSLLYNISELTQCGKNFIFIGLTYSLDCFENLEKRVRSRLMANFIDLELPYRTRKELHAFAKSLNNGVLTSTMERGLNNMMLFGVDRSVTSVKEFLFNFQKLSSSEVDHDVMINLFDYVNKTDLDTSFLSGLTKFQFELTKLAACICSAKHNSGMEGDDNFDLMEIQRFADQHNLKKIITTSHYALKECSYLIERGIFRQLKSRDYLTPRTKLSLCYLSGDFKKAIESLPQQLRLYDKSDELWKRLD